MFTFFQELWNGVADEHFVRICERIPEIAWLGPLLYKLPEKRARLETVLFPE
jgi:hypothetical protein